LIEHEYSKKRDCRKSMHLLDDDVPPNPMAEPQLIQLLAKEPDPAFAAEMVDNCRHLLGKLWDDQLRAIALGKLEGYSNEEIAAKIDCAPATVERRLRLIRDIWWEIKPP
jgi:DNA-directed RNA polymerase specialized sigma24 family protein